MGEISKATHAIGAPLTVPEEGPVVSRDEIVTTTASSTTVTTVTKTRAEVNDATTGKQITRDTTTTVEKVERSTPEGVILIETTTSESWVKAEEGTLHFMESESTTTQSRPGSAGKDAPPSVTHEDVQPVTREGQSQRGTGTLPTAQPDSAPGARKSVVTGDDSPSTDPEHLQPPPHCEPKRRKSTDSRASHIPEPPH